MKTVDFTINELPLTIGWKMEWHSGFAIGTPIGIGVAPATVEEWDKIYNKWFDPTVKWAHPECVEPMQAWIPGARAHYYGEDGKIRNHPMASFEVFARTSESLTNPAPNETGH